MGRPQFRGQAAPPDELTRLRQEKVRLQKLRDIFKKAGEHSARESGGGINLSRSIGLSTGWDNCVRRWGSVGVGMLFP